MSTRKGKIVLLEEVLHDAIKAARDAIESRNPNLENKDEIARMVGVGAVIFHDLKNDRLNDIEFSLEAMLTFEGETGPYLQYTYARTCSLLRKSHVPNSHTSLYEVFEDDKVWPIIFYYRDLRR